MVKNGVMTGVIKGIKLPVEDREQVMDQFADDTSLTLLGEEESVLATISTTYTFCKGSGLVLNWDKSCRYWQFQDPQGRPPWTSHLRMKWAETGDVSKLLGSLFGLSLDSKSVDDFLLDRVQKKLAFWCTAKINTTGRVVIVNHVLLSALFFFIAI